MFGKRLRRTFKAMDLSKNRGIAIITVSALLFVFLGFGSLVFDIGYLHIVKGELQNAADAGALAATAVLYDNFGENINPGANAVGEAAATANDSQNLAVEVFDALSNNGDVQRGHWSFATRTFTPNASLEVKELWGVSTAELDADTDFINAVRVRTRRENIPAYSILSKIYGHDSFQMHAEAVAYIGFTGSINPGEVDQPIAICKESIVGWEAGDEGEFTCVAGRMITSSPDLQSGNTAAWTNFTQPCETANNPSVSPYICGDNNPPLSGGTGMGATGGEVNVIYDDLRSCWLNSPELDLIGPGSLPGQDGIPDQPWNMSLPVVECPGNNVSNCPKLVGVVNVNMLWIRKSNASKPDEDIPLEMAGLPNVAAPYVCSHKLADPTATVESLSEEQLADCWTEFVDNYGILRANNIPIDDLTPSQLQKTIIFVPDCSPHELKGTTGGPNLGVLAKIPVLVQ